MRNLRLVVTVSLAVLSFGACSSTGGTTAAPPSGGTTSVPPSESAPASPLLGEWHQQYSCEDQVRTFQRNLSEQTPSQNEALAALAGNDDTSTATLLKEYTREFAWGPNAKTATQLTPEALCNGASDRERTILFQEDVVVVQDWDGSWGPATLTIVDDHTFTANDGFGNWGPLESHPTAKFFFQIDGDTLTITTAGIVDAWAGTALEDASWARVS